MTSRIIGKLLKKQKVPAVNWYPAETDRRLSGKKAWPFYRGVVNEKETGSPLFRWPAKLHGFKYCISLAGQSTTPSGKQ